MLLPCACSAATSRAGELGLLLVALIIAVTSLTSVGFFTDRVARALKLEANQLLGGDVVLVADHALKPEWRAEATRRGLRAVERQLHQHGHPRQGPRWPASRWSRTAIRCGGAIRIAPGLNQPDAPAPGIPARGELWLDERLASALGRRWATRWGWGLTLPDGRGAQLRVGPGANFFSLLPRLIINAADPPATQLIQPGSRPSIVSTWPAIRPRWRASRPGPGPPATGREPRDRRQRPPEVRTVLDRAERFLRFAAMLAVVLAAVAVGLATRRFVERHLDGCAVMRCLGRARPR